MAAEFYLARRYLLNHRPGAWGWMIGWLATGSVALGVAALVVTLAIMSGFREDIRTKILGVQPHVILSSFNGLMDADNPEFKNTLAQNKEILAWSPYITGQVLIGRGGQNSGALVKGIDPIREQAVANLKGRLIQGTWDDLAPPSEKPRIILGQELARNLGARVGDTVWLVTPGSLGINLMSVPKAHLFIVSGFIQTGLYDYDSTLAYAHHKPIQKVFDAGRNVSGIGVKVKNPDIADQLAKDIQIELQGRYWVRSWLSLNKNLFSALKLEKTVMFIVLTLITVVASVMIVSNLLLSIHQKTKEIGILRAIGATSSVIHKVFLLQGFLMGSVGTMMGVVLGVGISLFLRESNLIHLPADVYYIDHLPIQISPVDLITVVFSALLIVLCATLYPASRATQIDPLEAIRYG